MKPRFRSAVTPTWWRGGPWVQRTVAASQAEAAADVPGMRPFSLVRRIMALVVGVSLVALLPHALVLVTWLAPLGDQMGSLTATQARAVEAALGAVPPEDRDAVARAIQADDVFVSRAAPAPPVGGALERGAVPDRLQAQLDASLGRPVNVLMTMDPDRHTMLSVAVLVEGQTWWVNFPRTRPSLLWALLPGLGVVALIAAAAVLALVLGVRLITRPMSELAQAMLQRRNELRRIDEPAHVSRELQGVIRSFNSLVHAVELAAESRRHLLAGVSHDLRTPLARLRLRVDTECSEDVAQRMEADFVAVSRIIDQFLAYAQGQSGVAAGERHPLGELVEEVVGRCRTSGAEVTLARLDKVDLWVPELGLQRALVNLIDNARSHGKGVVEVELRAETAEVVLIVFDQGAGIAPADQERCFKPFVRLGPANDPAGHCGLGLAIVAQVAEQLGGRTVVKPFDGRRSGVGFGLPRAGVRKTPPGQTV